MTHKAPVSSFTWRDRRVPPLRRGGSRREAGRREGPALVRSRRQRDGMLDEIRLDHGETGETQ